MSDGFVATVRAEIRALDASPPALRRFGLAVGGVFVLLGAVGAWRSGWDPSPLATGLLVGGGLLMSLGLLVPVVLGPVFRVWMTGALAMGFVMTRVILTLALVVVFTPVALIFRIIRRDPLHRRPDPDAATYWIRRDDGPSGRHRLERMY